MFFVGPNTPACSACKEISIIKVHMQNDPPFKLQFVEFSTYLWLFSDWQQIWFAQTSSYYMYNVLHRLSAKNNIQTDKLSKKILKALLYTNNPIW